MSIFISYRRNFGDNHVAGRIYEWLERSFGKERVFKDVDSISLGTDFRKSLSEVLARCDVLLAVIGERWADATDEFGGRRLDDETDYVRLEIEAALRREIRVIPLLIDRTAPPKPKDLPESLKDLSYRQGMPVRPDPDFHWDMERLIRALEQVLDPRRASIPSTGSTRESPEQRSAPRGSTAHSQGLDPVLPVAKNPTDPPSTRVASAPAQPIPVEPATTPRTTGEPAAGRAPIVDADRLDHDRPAAAATPPAETPTKGVPPGRASSHKIDPAIPVRPIAGPSIQVSAIPGPSQDLPAAPGPPSTPSAASGSKVEPSRALRRPCSMRTVVRPGLVAFSFFMLVFYADGLIGIIGAFVYGLSIENSEEFFFYLILGVIYHLINLLIRIAFPIALGFVAIRRFTHRWLLLSFFLPPLAGGLVLGQIVFSDPWFVLDSFYAGAVAGIPVTLYLASRGARSMRMRLEGRPTPAPCTPAPAPGGKAPVVDDAQPHSARPTDPPSSTSFPASSDSEIGPRTPIEYLFAMRIILISAFVAFVVFLLLILAEGLIGLLGVLTVLLFLETPVRFDLIRESYSSWVYLYAVVVILLFVVLPVVVAIMFYRQRKQQRWILILSLVPPLVGGPLIASSYGGGAGFSAGLVLGMPVALYLAICAGRSIRRRLRGQRISRSAATRVA
jgi:hypothetical protein